MVDGYLNFDTKINAKGFTSGLGKLGNKLDFLKSKLKGIALTVGAVFGAKKVLDTVKSAVETAAEINAANSAMTQTFGALEGAATEAMQRIADESGIVRTRLQGAGTQIFAFARASGMNGASALNMMEDALKVAADSAAYYDRSLEDTTETLKSFLKGNFANDAALGISCTETTRNAAANKMFAKSYRELSEAQKQLVLLQMVKDANRLSGAEGQAAREAEGWENVLGNLKETWKQLLAVIGQPILHIAISAVKSLTSALAVLTEYAKNAVDALSELFGWETVETGAVASNISESVTEQNDLTEATEETTKAQKDLLSIDELHTVGEKNTENNSEKSAEIISAVPVIDKKEVKKTEKKANQLAEKIRRIFEPIKLAWELDSPELISQAKYAGTQLKNVFKSVGKSLEAVWTNGSGLRTMRNLLHLATDFLGVIGDLSGAFHRAWEDGGRGTKYIQSISDKWNSLLELIHTVTQSFRDAWNSGNGEKILGHILDIFTGLNNITANLRTNFALAWEENGTGERIFDGILKTVDSVLGTFDGIVSDTEEWSKNVDFAPLLEGLAELSESLAPLADTIGEGLREFWNEVCLPLGTWLIEKGIPGAITLVRRAVDDLNAALQALKPYLSWFIDELAKPAGNFLGGAWEALTDPDIRPTEIFEGLGGEIADGTFWDTWAAGAEDIFDTTELSKNMEKFGEGVYDFFSDIGDGISAVIQFFKDFERSIEDVGETVFDAVHNIGEWFSGLWDGIKKTFSGIGKWFGDKFTAAKNAVTNAFEHIGGWFSERWSDIKDAFSAVGNWFADKFQDAYDGICKVFSAIGDWFSDRWADIKNALSAVKTWFADKFRTAYEAICKIFSGIGNWYADRWADIKNVFAKIKNWFAEKFQSAYDAVTGIFKNIGGWFRDRWDDIKDVFAKIRDWFSEKFQSAYNAVTDVFKGIGNWFKARWDDITGAFSNIGRWFSEKFQAAYDKITSIFSGIGDFFSGIWEGIKNGVKSVINFVLGGINGLIEMVESGINFIVDGLNSLLSFTLPDWIPGIGGETFSVDIPHAELPRIPYLAQGTVVPANYGNFLAVLGDNKREPEIVAPESAIRKAVAAELSALKTGGDITVKLVCDGRTLAQIVQKYDLKNRRAMNGGS